VLLRSGESERVSRAYLYVKDPLGNLQAETPNHQSFQALGQAETNLTHKLFKLSPYRGTVITYISRRGDFMTNSRPELEQHKHACRKKKCLHHPAMECPTSDEPCIFERKPQIGES